MGGFVIGPAIGAFAAALVGGFAFPFILTGVLGLLAAGVLAVAMPRRPHVVEDDRFEHHPEVEVVITEVGFGGLTTQPAVPTSEPESAPQAPWRALGNRVLLAAIIIGFGLQLSFGTYEVVWSFYLIDLGASIEWVGLTFVLFGIPSMIVSPIAGRLVDRHGPMRFIVVAALVVIVSGILYAIAVEPLMPSLVVPIEATATAIMSTALFTLVAVGTPLGRSATAQGIYGASGTIALIIASITAGALWEQHSAWPFWFFVIGMAVCLVLGVLVYYGLHWRRPTSAAREGSA
jgi:MFS family permease